MDDSRLKLKTAEEAEKIFYEAFMNCDTKMMSALWANRDVVCIHPGSNAIVGYEAVVQSWRQIFNNALPTHITFTVVNRFTSDDLMTSVVVEEISSNGGDSVLVLASNVYQKIDGGWLMVEHHGSLVQSHPQKHTLQ